ncbi:MAG: DHHA1 domain-containing protein [Candidatus Hodarchaeota archaeon]
MRVVTHTDIDGICCAALFLRKFGFKTEIIFATVKEAKQLSHSNVSIDYTCDLPKIGTSINLDHHKSNFENLVETNRLTEHDWVDPNASSATDLVFKRLDFGNDPIAKEIKELGHFADTAQLPDEYRPLEMVLSVNNDDTMVLRRISELLAEFGRGILTNQWLIQNHINVQSIFDETQQRISDFLRKTINFPNIIILDTRGVIPGKLAKEVIRPIFDRGVSVIAVVYSKSYEEPIRVSLRVTKTKQDLYDVSLVAKAFNGGGHRMAAACSPKKEDIPNKLKRELIRIAKPSDNVQYIHLQDF